MIIQPYVFTGNDPQEVYQRVRRFCARLHEAGINPESIEGVRSNTKYYPDTGATMTTVEVFPGISVSEQFAAAERIYAESIFVPLDELYGEVVKAFSLLPPFPRFRLDVGPRGFLMNERIVDDEWRTIFEDVREWDLVRRVERALIDRGLIEEKQAASSAGDFDPFLDDPLP